MRSVLGKLSILTSMVVATFLISGCADTQLSDLEVESGNHVATYDVVDGM